ncbi:MAG TPA: DUF72 domain-containing protein [Actinomycetota bacterium]|nr:DUF72 domain-containing protein [Actinomycetota bacterium]
MGGSLYLGTSGFAYKEWKGIFYPDELKDGEMLPYYASRFASVEINYTFRRSPAETTVRTWSERTPDGFRFALKAHQRITHTRRLDTGDEGVAWFLDRVRPLGQRLGPILFQCPPTLRFDAAVLDAFLSALPEGRRYAMEFRHDSWAQARETLRERGVAWCVAESDESPGAPAWLAEQPFGYLRLRKETYADADLRVWADRISEMLRSGRDVYCYLKHEEEGTGPRYAERLGELLDAV